MKTLEKILSIGSVPGKTEGMITYLREQIEGLFDYSQKDALGSVCFVKKIGSGKKLLISCPIDFSGVVATFVDGSKISVAPVGGFFAGALAFEKVCFDGLNGVLIPPADYNKNTPATDFYVETGDEKAQEKITLGDIGCFESKPKILPDGSVYSFGCGTKICIYTLVQLAKSLLCEPYDFLTGENIGEVCFAFFAQDSLGHRGASTISSYFNPDMILNFGLIDAKEKNAGQVKVGTFNIKMLDKGFVADKDMAEFVCRMSDYLNVEHTKCINAGDLGAISRLSLCEKGCSSAEISIAVENWGTVGEYTKIPYKA